MWFGPVRMLIIPIILRQLFNSLTYIYILCMKPSPESWGNSTKNGSISTVMAIQNWFFTENWKEVEFSPTCLHLLAKSNIADLEVSSGPVRQMTENHAILKSQLRTLTLTVNQKVVRAGKSCSVSNEANFKCKVLKHRRHSCLLGYWPIGDPRWWLWGRWSSWRYTVGWPSSGPNLFCNTHEHLGWR